MSKKRTSLDLTLVLPCWNEALLLVDSVERIREALVISRFRWEIIFVDDKSSDSTAALIKELVKKNKNYRAVFHKTNTGRGQTVADGIRKSRGTVVGYMDVDCEVSPIYIPTIVNMILKGKADMVLGKRLYRTTLSSIVRELLSAGYRVMADKMVSTGGLDTETGYKFFNRKKIVPILRFARHPHWFWDTEIVVFARRAGLRVVEVPVLFLRRFDKKSSVNMVEDVADYLQNLWALWRRLL